jgi:hypothetical protein
MSSMLSATIYSQSRVRKKDRLNVSKTGKKLHLACGCQIRRRNERAEALAPNHHIEPIGMPPRFSQVHRMTKTATGHPDRARKMAAMGGWKRFGKPKLFDENGLLAARPPTLTRIQKNPKKLI